MHRLLVPSELHACGTWYPAARVFVRLDESFHDGPALAYVMDEMNSSSDVYGTHFHWRAADKLEPNGEVDYFAR